MPCWGGRGAEEGWRREENKTPAPPVLFISYKILFPYFLSLFLKDAIQFLLKSLERILLILMGVV